MSSNAPRRLPYADKCGRATTWALLATLLLPLGAYGADSAIVLPLYDVPGAHTSADRGQDQFGPSGQARESERRATADITKPAPRFALVEMPPEAVMPGAGAKRPHHAVGYRWLGAESWLREQGLEVQTCYLPMVRMHTKLSPSRLSGTLWVYGRCSFR